MSELENNRMFESCWECEEPLTGDDTFPLCDDCVIAHGDGYRWCCKDEHGNDPSPPYRISLCIINEAFWRRYDAVFARRALATLEKVKS